MKKIITAIGDEKLNNVLRKIEEIEVINSDIQYQEGILETIEIYEEIDYLILSENLIGSFKIEELIRYIKILREELKIIVVTNEKSRFDLNKNVSKVVNNNKNYVKETINYILGIIDIKHEQILDSKYKSLTEVISSKEKWKDNVNKDKVHKKIYTKKKIPRNIITVIGCSGVRKNYIYFNTCKIN